MDCRIWEEMPVSCVCLLCISNSYFADMSLIVPGAATQPTVPATTQSTITTTTSTATVPTSSISPSNRFGLKDISHLFSSSFQLRSFNLPWRTSYAYGPSNIIKSSVGLAGMKFKEEYNGRINRLVPAIVWATCSFGVRETTSNVLASVVSILTASFSTPTNV